MQISGGREEEMFASMQMLAEVASCVCDLLASKATIVPMRLPMAMSVWGEWYSSGKVGNLIQMVVMFWEDCFSSFKFGLQSLIRMGSWPILHREVKIFTLSSL